jgi:xanthine dehydrogenase accessory factor
MKAIYKEMLELFAAQGEVLIATELAPVCGKKYLEKDFAAKGIKVQSEAGFPQLLHKDGQDIFIEKLSGEPELILVGGGHVSLETAKIAKILDFSVTVIDDRAEFANKARFPQVDKLYCQDIEAALANPFPVNAYYVIVTRGHKDDLRALKAALAKPYRYIGMIGSRGKVAYTMKQLKEQGYEDAELKKVHAPIGLSIGAITPAEIAVSILAEIIKEMNKNVNDKHQLDICREMEQIQEAATLVTIVEKRGSSPRGVGSKMLVGKSGKIVGTIGGGAIEYQAAKRAAEIAGSGKAEVQFYDLSLNDASNLGMACGGAVKVLLESLL